MLFLLVSFLKFKLKAVQLMDVNPKVGPQSGGTHLYLAGSNFNIGSNIEIYLDDMPCDIKKSMIANRQVTCRTSPSLTAPYWVQKLTLLLDGANLTLPRPAIGSHALIGSSLGFKWDD
ncbi:plexin-B-like [Tetranychus urticae]|nr:plexin-B-like [Tetranychus urticae]